MNYPKIDRDLVDFSSNTEVCNIGFHEGILRDGRPYRIEVWTSYNVETATIFISNIDLEEKSDADLIKYIAPEKIIDISDDKSVINEYTDSNNNIFYSINLVLNDHGNEINKLLVKLNEYN